MDSLILRTYETFDEMPCANLLVNDKSNLMYVRIGRNAFITREFIDKIVLEDSHIIYKINYLNVKEKEEILTLEIIKNRYSDEIILSNKRNDIDIIPLNEILKIEGNSVTFLSLDDVNSLIDYKGEFVLGKKNSII